MAAPQSTKPLTKQYTLADDYSGGKHVGANGKLFTEPLRRGKIYEFTETEAKELGDVIQLYDPNAKPKDQPGLSQADVDAAVQAALNAQKAQLEAANKKAIDDAVAKALADAKLKAPPQGS